MVVRYGHTGPVDHPQHLGAVAFAKYVTERSRGEIEVRVFPFGQLGGERPMLEQVRTGTLHITAVSAIVLANYVKEAGVIGLPFVYPDLETAYKVLDDKEVMERLSGFTEQKGLVLIGYGENEARDFTNWKGPVRKPGDFRGLRVRVAEGPIYMDMFRALGAEPVFLPLPEVYSALERKLIDGQEFSLSLAVSMNFIEVNRFATMTDHILVECPLMVSKSFWETLSPEQKTIFRGAGEVQARINREGNAKLRALALEQAKARRVEMTLLTPAEREGFRAALKPVHDKYRSAYGAEWYDFFIKKIEFYQGKR
ncbi:MAG TPA: DctP family TRAP transporter solute-binding subunit [Syntrophorhabdaceae bacterium]|jgi:tripartite ATP-independent transporter DctP family solute receptor